MSRSKLIRMESNVNIDDIKESSKDLYKKLLGKFITEFDNIDDDYDVLIEANLVPSFKGTRLDPPIEAYFEDLHICLVDGNQTQTITELLTKEAKQDFLYWLEVEAREN